MAKFSNEKEFIKAVTEWDRNKVPADWCKFIREMSMLALQRLVTYSPIGDPSLWKSLDRKSGQRAKPPTGYTGGTFAANWQVGIGHAPAGKVDSQGPDAAVSLGMAAMAGLSGAPIGTSVWLVNNMEYARRLEDGHSTQAPNGMVAITLAELSIGHNKR